VESAICQRTLGGLYARHRGKIVSEKIIGQEARILKATKEAPVDGSTRSSLSLTVTEDPRFSKGVEPPSVHPRRVESAQVHAKGTLIEFAKKLTEHTRVNQGWSGVHAIVESRKFESCHRLESRRIPKATSTLGLSNQSLPRTLSGMTRGIRMAAIM
jgi:hypothetical protein